MQMAAGAAQRMIWKVLMVLFLGLASDGGEEEDAWDQESQPDDDVSQVVPDQVMS